MLYREEVEISDLIKVRNQCVEILRARRGAQDDGDRVMTKMHRGDGCKQTGLHKIKEQQRRVLLHFHLPVAYSQP